MQFQCAGVCVHLVFVFVISCSATVQGFVDILSLSLSFHAVSMCRGLWTSCLCLCHFLQCHCAGVCGHLVFVFVISCSFTVQGFVDILSLSLSFPAVSMCRGLWTSSLCLCHFLQFHCAGVCGHLVFVFVISCSFTVQ